MANSETLFSRGIRSRHVGPVSEHVQRIREISAQGEQEKQDELLSGVTGGVQTPDLHERLMKQAAAGMTRHGWPKRPSKESEGLDSPRDGDLMIGTTSMTSQYGLEEAAAGGRGWHDSTHRHELSPPYTGSRLLGKPAGTEAESLSGIPEHQQSLAALGSLASLADAGGWRRQPFPSTASLITVPSRLITTTSGKPTPGRGYAIVGGVSTPMASDATVAALVSPFTSRQARKLAFKGGSGTNTPFATRATTSTAGGMTGGMAANGRRKGVGRGPALLRTSASATRLGSTTALGGRYAPAHTAPGGSSRSQLEPELSSVLLPANGTHSRSLGELALPMDSLSLQQAAGAGVAGAGLTVPVSTLAALGRGSSSMQHVTGGHRSLAPLANSWRQAEMSAGEARGGGAPRRGGVRGGPSVPVAPLSHTSAAMLASLPQEERKVLLLQEWIQAYGDEASGGAAFQSPLLRVEAKLGRAIVFSEAVPPPSDIPTAVAFEALQVAEESSGALRPLLRLLRRVLMQAVYVEPASDPEGVSRPAALAERGGSAAMQRYLAHTLHAAEALRMREERERVRAVAERLRGTLVAWERARQEQLLKAEQRKQVAGTWQRLLSKTTQQQSANARAELSASIGAGETDGAMASGYGTVDGAVDAFLAIDGEEMRLQAIMAALETMPHALRTVVRRLMVGTEETRAAIGAAPAAQLALEALTERAEQLEPAVLTRFVDSLFSSASVGADPAVLSAMLSKAVEAAGTAGLEALPGILRMLMRSGGGRWRGPAVRFLSSVDSDLLLPGEVDAHVAGQQVEGVRVLRPGELGSSVGRMFNRDELTTLLRDLLDLLHGAAADSVIAAIVDPRGPLHQSFGGDIAAADRLALLRLLLETSSAEEVLAAMPDRLLRELKLGMFAVEAAPRPTSGSSGAGGGDAKETKSAARSPAQRKPRVPPQLASLRKYLGAPPKNLKSKAKIKSERAASLVYEIWAAKAREDTFDDSRGEERQGLGAYTRDYLLQKLGLASLADGALYGIVDAVRRFGTKNSRLVLFGRMMGVLDADTFSPRLSDTFLNLCKRCFPKFTDKTLKNRPVGTCFVPLEIATGAFNRVFPSADQRVRPSTERIALEMDLKAMLGREVHANAVEYSSVARTGPDDDGPAGAKTGRAIRGGPDFSGSTIVVDFDWLAGRVLDVWQTQRERDKRSMQRLFVMHDADKNGVLSFDEFIAMLADCTPNAKSKAESTAAAATVSAAPATVEVPSAALGDGEESPLVSATASRSQQAPRSNAELVAVTAAATASFRAARPRPPSTGSSRSAGSVPDLLATRRAVKLFEEVLRIAEESGVSDDPDSASPEDFAALCDEHGIMPPPQAREQTPAALLAPSAGAEFEAFADMPDHQLGGSVTGIAAVDGFDDATPREGRHERPFNGSVGRHPSSTRARRLAIAPEDDDDFDITGSEVPPASTSSVTSSHSQRFVVGTPAGSAGDDSQAGSDSGRVPGSSVLSRLPSSRLVRVRSRLSVTISDEDSST